MKHYKVAMIGGGPGGYVTALRLQQYGIETVVFEKNRLGGVCLNKGCIPTKTLVKTAELYHEILHAEEFGISVENPSFDFSKVYARKDAVVDKLISGIEFMFKKKKISLINEKVVSIRKEDKLFTIKSENEEVTADYVILGTGSDSRELPTMPFDHDKIISSDDILKIEEMPKSLTIVGGGVIGSEFASIFNQMGAQVTILELMPRLVVVEDEEISKRLAMSFKKNKIKLHLKTGFESYETTEEGVKINLPKGKSIESEKVLVCIGRVPVCDISFENMEVDYYKQAIKVDDFMRTSVTNMFAIGDLNGRQMLAHTASKQGLMVASIIKSELEGTEITVKPFNYDNTPRCTFTYPEIASVGITEAQAKEQYGEDILVGKFPYSASGKAMGMGETFGFCKAIAVKSTGKLIGMHIIGLSAAELIAQGAILIGRDSTIKDVEKIIFAHPTLSEVVMESIEDLEGMSIHKV